MLIYKNIMFEFFVHIEDDDPGHGCAFNWSRICISCADNAGICLDEYGENDSEGSLCGVQGCENEADYYLNFDGTETVV